MNYHRAVEHVNRKVLIVDKDYKIIGTGKTITMVGNETVSISIDKEYEDKLLKGLSQMSKSLMHSIGHIRCCPLSGAYIQPTLDLGDEENDFMEEVFSETHIVDEVNLRYRMVPEFFKDVKGYGASSHE